jgi:hypothetical protein
MRNLWIGFVAMAVLVTAVSVQAKTHYPRSVAGLEEQIGDIVTTAADGPSDLLTYRVQQLVIPSYGNYFSHVFGFKHYKPVADEYSQLSKDTAPLAQLFVKLADRKQTEITVVELKDENYADVRGLQRRAFLAMHHPQTLYTVKLTREGEDAGQSLWSFVYVDGAFRFAGKMRALTKVPVETR